MQKILIIDYGMANLRSVQKAFEKVGHVAVISGDPNRIAEADKVVLPGVGAFRDAIARLHEAGLAVPLVEHLRAGKPFFGICLGLQLLFTTSHEDGQHRGLEPTSPAQTRAALGWPAAPSIGLFRPLLLCGPKRSAADGSGDGLSDAIYLGYMARPCVRHAVSSGKEPTHRLGNASPLRRMALKKMLLRQA